MTPEAKFWEWMRPKLAINSGIHLLRIENSTGRGTPDLNICLNGIEIWVELKVADPQYRTRIRKEQNVFGIKRSLAGGRAFVISLQPDECISIWRYPMESVPDKEYRIITDNNYFICDKDTFDNQHVLHFLFHKP